MVRIFHLSSDGVGLGLLVSHFSKEMANIWASIYRGIDAWANPIEILGAPGSCSVTLKGLAMSARMKCYVVTSGLRMVNTLPFVLFFSSCTLLSHFNIMRPWYDWQVHREG
jgi:hypothetical protein